jgi:hypothetical protein
MDIRLLLMKLRSPFYAYWQRKYYRSVQKEDFGTAMSSLKNISKHFNGLMPPYWGLELAKIRQSLGQYDKAATVLDELVVSINKSEKYNGDTKKFLFKHLEKTHSEVLKMKHGITGNVKIDGVIYVDLSEIELSKVDQLLLEGWPLEMRKGG